MSGHFSAMQRQLKRNEAAKAARREQLLQKKKDLLGSKGYIKITAFDFPEVSKTELKKIKENIRRNIKIQKNKNLLFLIILIVIASAIVFKSIDFTIAKEVQQQELFEDTYLVDNINEYTYLLDDGDQWIEKRNWHNAIYRYKEAVELFPAKYEANYRLALAYSYNCQNKNRDCAIGAKLTERLLEYYPDEIDLIKLKIAFKDYTRYNSTNKLTNN